MHIRRLTIWLCVMFALSSISALAQNKSKAEPQTLTVNGTGDVKTKPDVAYVTFGVVTQATKAQEASATNAALAQKVTAVLKSLGVADKDIRTSQYNIFPRYDNRPGKGQNIIGYEVSDSVRACIYDLTTVGKTIDASLTAGANNVQGVSFALEKKTKSEDAALADAVKDARRKADILASAAGVRIVGVQQIQEGSANRPMPVYAMRSMAMTMGAPTPITPGEISVTANVTITYLIAPEK